MSGELLDIVLRLGAFALAGALSGLASGALRFGGGALAAGTALTLLPDPHALSALATAAAGLALVSARAAAARRIGADWPLAALAALGGAGAAGLASLGSPRIGLAGYGLAALLAGLAPLLRPPRPAPAWSAPAALLLGMVSGGAAVGAGAASGAARRMFGWRDGALAAIGGASCAAAALVYALEGRMGAEAPTPLLGLLDPLGAVALAAGAMLAAPFGAQAQGASARMAASGACVLLGLSALAAALK